MGDWNIFHHMPWSSSYSIYFFVIGISAALFFLSTLSWFSDDVQADAGVGVLRVVRPARASAACCSSAICRSRSASSTS